MAAAALDRLIADRVAAVPGGIADQIVRLRVYDVPAMWPGSSTTPPSAGSRPRRCIFISTSAGPRCSAPWGSGAPGRRQTLPELVRDYLARRPLPAELDREAFVRLGGELIDSVERDLAGG